MDAGAADLDAPLAAALARAQALGEVDATITVLWGVASLYALVYVAWEQVAGGHLAPRHAAPLVMRTWRNGVVPRA